MLKQVLLKGSSTFVCPKDDLIKMGKLFLKRLTFLFIYCRLLNTTAIGMCLNNSNEDLKSNMKTNTSETPPNTNNVIIFGVYVLVTTMFGIIGIASYKRLKKNKGNFRVVCKHFLFTICRILLYMCKKNEREREREF